MSVSETAGQTGGDAAAAARAAAAGRAATLLRAGATIGLGSGRAVAAVIAAAAARWPDGPPLLVAAASTETDRLAHAAGFPVVALDDLELRRGAGAGAATTGAAATGANRTDAAPGAARRPLLDLVIDGADEVDPRLDMIKGGGGALLRERLIAAAAARVVIVVEDEKLVARLGERHALPVEVVRFAWRETRARLLELVPTARLRRAADGRAFVTDEGHHILDCDLPTPAAGGGEGLAALAAALKALPGVVDHGLFLGIADEVLVGHPDGAVDTLTRT